MSRNIEYWGENGGSFARKYVLTKFFQFKVVRSDISAGEVVEIKKQILLFFCIALVSCNLLAYEIDNFTNRKKLESLPDSLKKLNFEVNKQIQFALDKFNEVQVCSYENTQKKESVAFYIKAALDSNPVARIEDWAEQKKNLNNYYVGELERKKVFKSPFEELKQGVSDLLDGKLDHIFGTSSDQQDIYSGSSFWSGAVRSVMGLGPSINLNGVVIGVDKLGHFMAQGYEYWSDEKGMQSNSHLSRALSQGESLENSLYGFDTTGVKSYADLAANFSGMLFWKELVDGNNPYVKCVGNKFILNRDFNWADYIHHGWDEGINCSVYTESLEGTVKSNLKRLGLSCPISVEKCNEAAKIPCAERLISPACKKLATEINTKCDLRAISGFEESCHKCMEIEDKPSEESIRLNQSIQKVIKNLTPKKGQ